MIFRSRAATSIRGVSRCRVTLSSRLRDDELVLTFSYLEKSLVNLIVLVIILLILFGGGGFYFGGPYVGGGLGTVLLIVLIVLLLRG
jgi:hypothetical protein